MAKLKVGGKPKQRSLNGQKRKLNKKLTISIILNLILLVYIITSK